MKTTGHVKVYVDGNYVREYLSVSRTKAYEIICEIEANSQERNAVVKLGRSKRVRKDAFERWVFEHGVAGAPSVASTKSAG